MDRSTVKTVTTAVMFVVFLGSGGQAQVEIPLEQFEPEHYRYTQAETCVNCHQDDKGIMARAVGVSLSSGSLELDHRGWLSSVHARSQSHDYRINTACAWCHSPTTDGATQDSLAASPIQPGTWEGITCGACHPIGVPDSLEESKVTNLVPGSDRTDPASYVFIDRSDPTQLNAQCQYCHHEFHGFVVPTKTAMMESGMLRCVDCHMAGFGVVESALVERFHNFKVEANGPLSCSGTYGTEAGCHTNATADWVHMRIANIKGQRQDW